MTMAEGLSHVEDNNMRHEWQRLATYSKYDSDFPVSAINLAKDGFFRIGMEEVKCFSCGIVERNWRPMQNVPETHRRISPRCRYINRHGMGNVPIHKRNEHHAHTTRNDIRSDVSSSSLSVCNTGSPLVNELSNPVTDGQPPDSGYDSNALESTGPSESVTNSQRSCDTRQLTASSASADYSIATPPSLLGLGLNFQKPKYPQYSSVPSRIKTYEKWPMYLTQTAEEMAKAGFVFAGHQDYTRCFFCGGGLRNWEPGDDPWVEHARWFPKCMYVRQNKGEKWVHSVLQACKDQIKNAGKDAGDIISKPTPKEEVVETPCEEFTSTNLANPPESTNSESTTSINPADDIWNIPAVKSVEEIMHYSRDVITQAVEVIKKRKNLNSMNAAELMDVILDIEDGSLDSDLRSLTISENTSTTNEKSAKKSPASSQSEEMRRQLMGENQELKEEQICKICREKTVAIVFLPCGHYITCMDCAPSVSRCPACNLLIQGTIKAFLV